MIILNNLQLILNFCGELWKAPGSYEIAFTHNIPVSRTQFHVMQLDVSRNMSNHNTIYSFTNYR